MISFVESGMTFSFSDSDIFQIEKSPTYLSLKSGTKVCLVYSLKLQLHFNCKSTIIFL